MDIEKTIHQLIKNADLRKGVWTKKVEEPLEKKRKKVLRIGISLSSILIVLGAFSAFCAYLFSDYIVFLITLVVVFLSVGVFILFLARQLKKMEEKIRKLRKSPTTTTLYEFSKHPTVSYYSMTEVSGIIERDVEKIALCIKDSLIDTEMYTFNIILIEDKEVNLRIVPVLSSKKWILHDGHSPLFMTLELLTISGYGRDIFGIGITVKKEEHEHLIDKIGKIKEKARECAIRIIDSRTEKG